jgi:TolB-like protein/Flp pilus assembly protein TadD
VRRWALSSSGFVETPVAAPPIADIPPPPEPEADRPSIAVLPFAPASKDEDSEIFADGMTDDVISLLARVPGFLVTSRGSTFAYKGLSCDARQAGHELGVRYVVEGSVRRSRDKVRVTAELVEAQTGNQICSERFEGDASDIFKLQDEVANGIVGQLEPELMWAEGRRSSQLPTENLDAWSLLHSARMIYYAGHRRGTLEEARRIAEQALKMDPDYADAHGFLAELLPNLVTPGWSDDPEGDMTQAEAHYQRAMELDPNSSLVLTAASIFKLATGNTEAALSLAERSCEINPNDAFAQTERGVSLGALGRGEEGLAAVDLALRLSPRDPRTYIILAAQCWVYLCLERYEQAEQSARLGIERYNNYFLGWMVLALALAVQGKRTDAEAAVERIKSISPDITFDAARDIWRTISGNPVGNRGALIDRQIDSLRDVWPSGDGTLS